MKRIGIAFASVALVAAAFVSASALATEQVYLENNGIVQSGGAFMSIGKIVGAFGLEQYQGFGNIGAEQKLLVDNYAQGLDFGVGVTDDMKLKAVYDGDAGSSGSPMVTLDPIVIALDTGGAPALEGNGGIPALEGWNGPMFMAEVVLTRPAGAINDADWKQRQFLVSPAPA